MLSFLANKPWSAPARSCLVSPILIRAPVPVPALSIKSPSPRGLSYAISHPHTAQLARPFGRRTTLAITVSATLPAPLLHLPLSFALRPMSSASASASASSPSRQIKFGPFDVSTQVFYETPLSFALVNLKPLLPGHVLVCPKKPHHRLTDLDAAELGDLFAAVQVVQHMLAGVYFGEKSGGQDDSGELLYKGSFNIAVQDGPEAGQTVPHVHVHVIPRIRGTSAKDSATEGDALYEQMAEEPGNVGGAQWDAASDTERQDSSRPQPGGRFPRIEDSSREARTMAAMEAEAAHFRQALANLGIGQGV